MIIQITNYYVHISIMDFEDNRINVKSLSYG